MTETQVQTLREFAIDTARLLADRRCEHIRLIDVTGLSQLCDFLIVANGTSERQMKSVASEIEDIAEASSDHQVFRSNRDAATTWVVIDLVDLVVHLFEPNLREYYDLDGLWAAGEVIDWRRDDQKTTHQFEGPFESADEDLDADFDDDEQDDAAEDL